MSDAQPIKGAAGRSSSLPHSPFGSYLSASPIAQESIARDLAECSEEDAEDEESVSDESLEANLAHENSHGPHSMVNSYRRPSNVAYGGGTRPAITPNFKDTAFATKKERKRAMEEERSLLRDNYLAPPKHQHVEEPNTFTKTWKWLFSPRRPKPDEEDGTTGQTEGAPDETTALLPNGGIETPRSRRERLDKQWEAAVAAGKIKTTWQRESKVLFVYSRSLVLTFLLQYSLTVASIFTVGHIGRIELGAVSLASMTANITGYAIYQGLATSLDTLCAQAYGSGNKHLVGLQLQRMVYFLWVLTIPIAIVWFNAEFILRVIVPNPESARLAGLYLRILLAGAPGFALFESMKRFVQAQGLFSSTLYVLLIAAPLNAVLNYLFVWHFHLGFIGAPIAVAITDNLLPLFLFLYIYLIDGRQCWNGFTRRAFHNWGPMIKLALPGLLMVEAEYLAFEILTLAASYFSTTHLAAQSILSTITALTFNIPFPISIAASTRVANLIGATLSDAAKTAGRVAFFAACISGLFNAVLLMSLRSIIPRAFTSDEEVVALVARVLPLCAAFQLFDALAACANGLLRGLGRQEIGGWTNLFCYYVVAMPISFGTAFAGGWELEGLWSGVALALGLVASIEGLFLYRTSWEKAVEEAQMRNAAA